MKLRRLILPVISAVTLTVAVLSPYPAYAESVPEGSTEYDTEASTEYWLDDALIETEGYEEYPTDLTDSLKDGRADKAVRLMTKKERQDYLQAIADANSTPALSAQFSSLLMTFRVFDEDTGAYREFARSYIDDELMISDDWTDGYEEFMRLIVGDTDCAENYDESLGYIKFLNCSGEKYLDRDAERLTVSDSITEETLLRIRLQGSVAYVVTQLPDDSDLPEELWLETPSDGAFYVCAYALDAETLTALDIRITLISSDGTKREIKQVTCQYDTGMDLLLTQREEELRKHLYPDEFWDGEKLRTVTVYNLTSSDNETDSAEYTPRDADSTKSTAPAADAENAEDSSSARIYETKALKGDRVSITIPEDTALYADKALTEPWIDDGDYVRDLTLYLGPNFTPAAEPESD